MDEEILNKLKLFQYIVPIATIIIYGLSILEVAAFYYINFNIDILSLLSLSEMLIISFPYLFLIFLVVLVNYAIFRAFYIENKILKTSVFIFIILLPIFFYFNHKSFAEIVFKFYFMLLISSVLIGGIYWLVHSKYINCKNKNIFSSLSLVTLNVGVLFFIMLYSIIIFLSSILVTEQIYSKKLCIIESNYYRNSEITNKSFYFLFESDNYIALYDNSNKETILILKDKIDLIKFSGK